MQCHICGERDAVVQAPGGAAVCDPCGRMMTGWLELVKHIGVDKAIGMFALGQIAADDAFDVSETEC